MRIALDMAGGDLAPESTIKGALLALDKQSAVDDALEVTLVGRRPTAEDLLPDPLPSGLNFLEIERDVSGNEPGIDPGRVSTSPIRTALRMHSEGQFDGVVSAGSTGSQVIASLIELGKIPGITRPAIGSLLPTGKGQCFLIDIGASLVASPHHLVQFALMGFVYVYEFLGIKEPRVGLLNVGKEDEVGSAVNIEAHKLLSASNLNYAGFVEGREIPAGIADVIITNGFVGNVLIKYTEGLPAMLSGYLDLDRSPEIRRQLKGKFDFHSHGGEPLLGVNGVSVICHGASSDQAISSSIHKAAMLAQIKLHEKLKAFLVDKFSTYFSQVKYLRSFRRALHFGDKSHRHG